MGKERWKKIGKIAHELGVQEARKESQDCNDLLAAEMLDPLYYHEEAKSLVRELDKDIVCWSYFNEKMRHLNDMKEIVEKAKRSAIIHGANEKLLPVIETILVCPNCGSDNNTLLDGCTFRCNDCDAEYTEKEAN